MKRTIAAVILCCLSSVGAAGQQNIASSAQTVDKLFEGFTALSPGCALGVERDGATIISKGYGMADLEHPTPLSPQSMFYVASISKQFTALSILLLAEEGKLQLTDSIRKTLPELPRYADQITIYQLLTHTSGIRDYLTLGYLAGFPGEDAFTDNSVLNLIARQKNLTFEPGSDFLYSNSGYALLSLVAKRVAGKTLNEVAQEKIFGPLQMKARFQHDHTALVPDKASGYVLRDGSWHAADIALDVVGDGGLYASIDSMLLWMRNLEAPMFGANALSLMQAPGILTSGKKTNYGMGLAPSSYRGLKIIEHNGAFGGYRAETLWFPEQRFSTVVLCNNSSALPGQLARQVAEVYLSAQMQAKPVANASPAPVTSLSPNELRAPSDDDQKPYIGDYRSAELDVTYHVGMNPQGLTVAIAGRLPVRLRSTGVDRMLAGTPIGPIEFVFARDGTGNVAGLSMSAGKIKDVEFRRIN